jgi:hypothetical protein
MIFKKCSNNVKNGHCDNITIARGAYVYNPGSEYHGVPEPEPEPEPVEIVELGDVALFVLSGEVAVSGTGEVGEESPFFSSLPAPALAAAAAGLLISFHKSFNCGPVKRS